MRSLVLTAACITAMFAAMCVTPGCARAQVSPELREVATELDALDAEIALIQDLNTLQLTRQQVQELIPAVETLRASATRIEHQRVAVLTQLRPLLQQMRDLLLRDDHPDDALLRAIATLQQQLTELDMQFDEATMQHAGAFRDILTEPQVEIVIGEEEARRQVVELLEWARELDDEAFEREVPPYAEELAAPEMDLGEEEILDLLSLARAMDAEQYQRSEPEIRGRLTELFRPTHEMADRIIAHVFLHEAMLRVLSDKLRVMTD